MSHDYPDVVHVALSRDVAEQLWRDALQGATYTTEGYLRLRALNPLGAALGYDDAEGIHAPPLAPRRSIA